MKVAQTCLTLGDLARIKAQEQNQAPLFLSEAGVETYGTFHSRTNQVAQALLSNGLGDQAPIAILSKDVTVCFELLFGCAKAGAIPIGINWRLSPPEIAFILTHSGARAMFLSQEFLPIYEAIKPQLGAIKNVWVTKGTHASLPDYEHWITHASAEDPEVTIDPKQPALQLYTSGTTGQPKGVLLTHEGFFAVFRKMAEVGDDWIGWHAQDTSFLALGIFHIGVVWWAIRGMEAGAKFVVQDIFVPWQLLEAIRKTVFPSWYWFLPCSTYSW